MQFFKEKINYAKCLLVGVIFQIMVFVMSNLLVLISQGYFPYPRTLANIVVFGSYLLIQGFITALVVVLFYSQLPASKFKAGIITGVLIMFFNNQIAVLISGIASIIQMIGNNVIGLNILILSDILVWFVLILIYCVSGVIMIFLLDKIYYQNVNNGQKINTESLT